MQVGSAPLSSQIRIEPSESLVACQSGRVSQVSQSSPVRAHQEGAIRRPGSLPNGLLVPGKKLDLERVFHVDDLDDELAVLSEECQLEMRHF